MALSIGVVAGSKIKVGQSVVEVVEVTSPELISVKVDGGVPFVLNSIERTEIMPDVFVCCGLGKTHGRREGSAGWYRLAFEAPRSIAINRMEPGFNGIR